MMSHYDPSSDAEIAAEYGMRAWQSLDWNTRTGARPFHFLAILWPTYGSSSPANHVIESKAGFA